MVNTASSVLYRVKETNPNGHKLEMTPLCCPFSRHEGHEQSGQPHQRDAEAPRGVRRRLRPAHQRADRSEKGGKGTRTLARVTPPRSPVNRLCSVVSGRWPTSPWGIFCCTAPWRGSTPLHRWSRAKRSRISQPLVRRVMESSQPLCDSLEKTLNRDSGVSEIFSYWHYITVKTLRNAPNPIKSAGFQTDG